LALTLNVSERVPARILGDQVRVKQILNNLMGNAIKFTATGTIDVAVDMEQEDLIGGARLRATVTDSGIGIPSHRLPHLFQAFVQADSSMTRRFGGTGLGLAISRQLVELMGGTIGVNSMPGRGSRFWFTVPVTAVSGEPPSESTSAPALSGKRWRNLRVLLAEDDPVSCRVASVQLSRLGCQVREVGSGVEVLEQLGKESADLILMDVQMPEMDGLEATRRIRAGAAGESVRDIIIVALTAHALAEDRDRCLDAGMNDYLTKPLQIALFCQVVDLWLESRDAPPQPSK